MLGASAKRSDRPYPRSPTIPSSAEFWMFSTAPSRQLSRFSICFPCHPHNIIISLTRILIPFPVPIPPRLSQLYCPSFLNCVTMIPPVFTCLPSYPSSRLSTPTAILLIYRHPAYIHHPLPSQWCFSFLFTLRIQTPAPPYIN